MKTAAEKNKADTNTYTKEGLLEVINALPIAIAVIDKNWVVVFANRLIQLMSNKNGAQLIGQVGGEAFGCLNSNRHGGCGFGPECSRCTVRSTIQETMDEQKAKSMIDTTMVLNKVGERHLRISTLPMTLNGENVVLLAIEDTTKAKKQAKIKIEKEKLSAVIQTAGAVCHEMSQPLMVVQGLSELLLEDMTCNDTHISNIREIKKQIEKLGDITRKLMTITHYRTKDYLNSEIIDIESASDSS